MSQAEKSLAVMEEAAARDPVVRPPAQSETGAILSMIERMARDPSIDPARVERFFDLHERALDRHAREAYATALAEMQPDLPVIGERGKIDLGGNKQGPTYALWEDINEAIRPVLATHGFALSFRTGREADKIVVTGILSHRGGHHEETTMHLPIDTGPGRNAVQAIGSSTSYGKRYTAGALLNLTSRLKEDRDDDGKAAGAAVPERELLTDDQLAQIRNALKFKGRSEEQFCKAVKITALADLGAGDFDKTMKIIANAKEAGK